MISVVLVASIALAVVLGYKTKINTGFFLHRIRIPHRMLCTGHEDEGADRLLAHQHHVRHSTP